LTVTVSPSARPRVGLTVIVGGCAVVKLMGTMARSTPFGPGAVASTRQSPRTGPQVNVDVLHTELQPSSWVWKCVSGADTENCAPRALAGTPAHPESERLSA